MELSIATGKNRKTKTWRNVRISWDKLVERLSETVRTPETFKEYCSYGKDRQADIKDRGGFVGGYLTEGKRHPANVKFRQVLTLDIDFAETDFWDDFQLFHSCAAVLHSTHKHSPDSPRYRLIIPLSRQCDREEYEALGRKLADGFDINTFDPTTFQPERLMYWPTSSVDAPYVFRHQKGKPLDVDAVLAEYTDHTDISEWPRPESESDIIRTGLKRQGDPCDKPGLIGAFNRAYPISRAIAEFKLPYEATDFDDRYTYTEGSTAAGALVYDDQFFYSHHSTDPLHGVLCNAFDLVRLSRFGFEDKEDGAKDITKRKSYILMTDMVAGINEVIRQVARRRLPEEDFADSYNDEWLGNLDVNHKTGAYKNTIPNFYIIFSNDPNLAGRFRTNLFTRRSTIRLPLPWDEGTKERHFTDEDKSALFHYLENTYGLYHATKADNALKMVFQANAFHPIREYLATLEWDGIKRVDRLLIDYMGADDTEFVRLATRKTLVAAVARVTVPGIKFDYILTQVGKEGIKKSRIFDLLAKEWFSDSFAGVEGQKAVEALQGSWIIEVGEMDGFRKSEMTAVKHFITKRVDRFRVAYGEYTDDFPRQCVFVANTNEKNPLKENNGNRRIWPVDVTGLGFKDVEEMPIDQIWAEAKTYYEHGEPLYFDADMEEEAREAQKAHTEVDDRTGVVHEFLKLKLPSNWDGMSLYDRRAYIHNRDEFTPCGTVKRVCVCVAEIHTELFNNDIKNMNTYNTKSVHAIMNEMAGWERSTSHRYFPIYGKQRAYVLTGVEVVGHFKRKAQRRADH